MLQTGVGAIQGFLGPPVAGNIPRHYVAAGEAWRRIVVLEDRRGGDFDDHQRTEDLTVTPRTAVGAQQAQLHNLGLAHLFGQMAQQAQGFALVRRRHQIQQRLSEQGGRLKAEERLNILIVIDKAAIRIQDENQVRGVIDDNPVQALGNFQTLADDPVTRSSRSLRVVLARLRSNSSGPKGLRR